MMTQEEYKSKFLGINNDFQVKLKSLAKEYAISNNPYKIGDVVTDHMGSIKIEQIKFYFSTLPNSSLFPSCTYFGIEVTKRGEPKKGGKKRSVYQENLINS
jgi:hypothetical protein